MFSTDRAEAACWVVWKGWRIVSGMAGEAFEVFDLSRVSSTVDINQQPLEGRVGLS